jgi:hypothetical protein
MLPGMREQHIGGCLCGAIRYAMAGPPTSSNICYCTQCQRQTGAPVPAFVSVETHQTRKCFGYASAPSGNADQRCAELR